MLLFCSEDQELPVKHSKGQTRVMAYQILNNTHLAYVGERLKYFCMNNWTKEPMDMEVF